MAALERMPSIYEANAVSTSTQDEENKPIQIHEFGPSDPDDPGNWTEKRKWLVAGTALVATLMLPVTGTSITVAAKAISAEFGVEDTPTFTNTYWTVTSWSIGGALCVAPGLALLEDFGVRNLFLSVYAFFLLMILPQALARNFATLVVCRFLQGGCVSLLANAAASVNPTLWTDNKQRTIPTMIYILFYVAGNSLGPPMFAGVMQNIGDWRWIFWIQLIVFGALFPLFVFGIVETRQHVILRRRARAIRKSTGRVIYTKEEMHSIAHRNVAARKADEKTGDFAEDEHFVSLPIKIYRCVIRPMQLLSNSPLLFFAMLWSSFSIGSVYLFTQSVEQVFVGLYDWSEFSSGYVQIAVVIGEILGFCFSLIGISLYQNSARRNTETPGEPIPEARLYISIPASFFGMAGGMMVYAWTSYPSLPWIAPAIGLAMVGFGIMVVVYAASEYVIDAYARSSYAASALSAVALGENVFAGLLPLAEASMYTNLGFHWASTLLGLLALLLSFAPVGFIWKGRSLREKSTYMHH